MHNLHGNFYRGLELVTVGKLAHSTDAPTAMSAVVNAQDASGGARVLRVRGPMCVRVHILCVVHANADPVL